MTNANHESRTWLITGCSTGFGRALAEAVLENVESLPMQTGMSSATQGTLQDFVDAVSEFYFTDDLRRDKYRESDAFAAFVREAESAFGNGSVTQIPVIEMRRR